MTEKSMSRIASLSQKAKLAISHSYATNMILPYLTGDEDIVVPITREDFKNINLDLTEKTIEITRKVLEDGGLKKNRIDKVVLVGGSSKISRIKLMLQEFFLGIRVSSAISSTEAVAYGETIAAATYYRGLHEKITDVTSLSLGVKTFGGKMSFVSKRNSNIPTKNKIAVSTRANKPPKALFDIYEGERLMVKYNTKLGSFNIDLPIKSLGLRVEVIFKIDANGVLQVGAEVVSKKYSSVQIQYESTDVAKARNITEEEK